MPIRQLRNHIPIGGPARTKAGRGGTSIPSAEQRIVNTIAR